MQERSLGISGLVSANSSSVPLPIVNVLSLLSVALVIGLYAWEMRTPIAQLDDAFISYRYAVNLVDGNGLVFNAGERVEGYTNLLWVLLVSLGLKLGISAPIFGHWLSLACGVLLLVSSYLYVAVLLPKNARPLAALAPITLFFCNSFVHWTSSGLEQGLFASLVVLALMVSTLERYWLAALFCSLAFLTRPEGALVAALLLNWPWIKSLIQYRFTKPRQLFVSSGPALLFGCVVIVLTLFRWFYYNDIVPNTFHAKVGGIPLQFGINYMMQFLADGPILLVPGMLIAAILVPRYRLGLVLWAIFAFYVLSVRGDVFKNGRFLLPVLPVMIAGGVLALHALYHKYRKLFYIQAVLLMGCVFTSLYFQTLTWPIKAEFKFLFKKEFPYSVKRDEHYQHDLWAEDLWIKRRVPLIEQADPPIQLIASIGIGRISYYLEQVKILDLVGLADKTIAQSERKPRPGTLIIPGHQRSDPDYVFARRPDLINIPRKSSGVFILPAVADLWNDPRLETDYHWDEKLKGYRINY